VIAKLTFHIERDTCWPNIEKTELYFDKHKMSDSCAHDMEPSFQSAWIQFVPIPPQLKMLPRYVVKSIVGDTFDVEIEIQEIVRMKSFHFLLWWDDHQFTTDYQNVWITDFLPPPYEFKSVVLTDDNGNDVYESLEVNVQMPCDKPPISGTGVLLKIRFTVLDPWGMVDQYLDKPSLHWNNPNWIWWDDERPAIPPYEDYSTTKIPHRWAPDKCANFINIEGYVDVWCPTYNKLDLYDPLGVWVEPWNFTEYIKLCETKYEACFNHLTVGPFLYEFRPIPGDLNLDGVVDITDLSAIAKVYGKFWSNAPRDGWPYYCNYPPTVDNSEWYGIGSYSTYVIYRYFADFDLTKDRYVDIFDVVLVAKNFGRRTPDPLFPQPLPKLDP
jgi:hypothetical protein